MEIVHFCRIGAAQKKNEPVKKNEPKKNEPLCLDGRVVCKMPGTGVIKIFCPKVWAQRLVIS
jgi:hypothetical protein